MICPFHNEYPQEFRNYKLQLHVIGKISLKDIKFENNMYLPAMTKKNYKQLYVETKPWNGTELFNA